MNRSPVRIPIMKDMLADRVCIITGGGRGIGRATAELFASEGGRVVISDLDEQPAQETVEAIKSSGGQAVAVVGDVTAQGMPEKIVQAAVGAYGPSIDVLANVAGFTWDGFIHKMTQQQWDAVHNIHLKAPFRLIQAASPYIRDPAKAEIKKGQQVMRKIINVSSVAGTDGNPAQANYSSAKAGVVGLTKTLSREWAPFNVNVNAVAFGWISTRMTQEREKGESIERNGKKIELGVPKQGLEAFKEMIPFKRPGTPEEAARAMLFFASSMSDYVTGQVLKVAGGWY